MLKRNSIFALILITMGFLMFFKNAGIINLDLSFFLISFAFLGVYIFLGGRKRYKNIIVLAPSLIILTLGLFASLDDNKVMENSENALLFLMLAVAFVLIFFIHNFRYKNLSFGIKYWPIFIAIILFLFSSLLYLLSLYNWMYSSFILKNLWPVLLLLMGVFITLSNVINEKRKKS